MEQAAEKKENQVVLYVEHLVFLTHVFCFSQHHLLFNDILPVDGGEELVGHHFFGIVWSTSQPVNKTKTFSFSPFFVHKTLQSLSLEIYNNSELYLAVS